MKTILLAEFRSVFDEQPRELNKYLTGISKSTLLKATAFFLGFYNDRSKFSGLKEFIGMFFCKKNNALANQIYGKLKDLSIQSRKDVYIVSPHSSLQLFEYCFDNLSEIENQSKEEAEINIFKACLLVNQFNAEKETVALSSTQSLPIAIKGAAALMSQTFPYSDTWNYLMTEVLITEVIKSVYLFEFLASKQQTQYLLEKFNEYFRCDNWKQYYKRFFPLAISVIKAEEEGYLDIHVQKDEKFQEGCDFVDKLILQDSEIIHDYDFKKIRGRPFYKISEGVYRVIFGLFVVEMIYKGLFFKLSEINNTLPNNVKIKDFRGFYCDDESFPKNSSD